MDVPSARGAAPRPIQGQLAKPPIPTHGAIVPAVTQVDNGAPGKRRNREARRGRRDYPSITSRSTPASVNVAVSSLRSVAKFLLVRAAPMAPPIHPED